MRKVSLITVLLVIAVMTMGVNKCQVTDSAWSNLAIKNSARGLGYAIGNYNNPVVSAAIVEAYNLFKTGQADPAKINELLGKFKQDPGMTLIILASLDLLEAMGATISGGTIVDLTGIPPEMWTMVEVAYQQGYSLGQMDKSKGITRAIP